jgi:zinc transport system substrate-binding protein
MMRSCPSSEVVRCILKRSVLVSLLVLVGFLSSGCTDQPAVEQVDAQPTIVATIYPLADLVGQLVGDKAEVVCLVAPGTSPHGFEPTAAQMAAMERAAVLVMVGMELDDWAARDAQRIGRDDLVVFSMAGSVGLDASTGDSDDQAGDAHHHVEHDEHVDHAHAGQADHDGHAREAAEMSSHAHDHVHDHHGVDPHLWLDPVLVRQMVPQLAEALARAMPEQADVIQQRREQLVIELEELDQAYRSRLAGFPEQRIVTFHSAFNRLAERYGLEVAATLSPIDAPGPLTVARLEQAIEAVQQYHLQVVFAEPQFPNDAAKLLARETGAEVLILDPLGDPNEPGRDSYIEMMRTNLQTLVDGLSRKPQP